MYMSPQNIEKLLAWVETMSAPDPLNDPGERPILVLIGPHCSGKTTLALTLAKVLGDGSRVGVFNDYNAKDIAAVAQQGKPLVFDNIIRYDTTLRDTMLEIAEMAKITLRRQLHEDEPEIVQVPRVPIIVTSLSDQFPLDWIDRCTCLYLSPIPNRDMVADQQAAAEIEELIQPALFKAMKEPDGDADRHDRECFNRTLQWLHWLTVELDSIKRIMDVMFNNYKLFGVGLGKDSIEGAANFLETYAALMKPLKQELQLATMPNQAIESLPEEQLEMFIADYMRMLESAKDAMGNTLKTNELHTIARNLSFMLNERNKRAKLIR